MADRLFLRFRELKGQAADDLKDKLIDAHIHTEIMGSDHCPVELTVEL